MEHEVNRGDGKRQTQHILTQRLETQCASPSKSALSDYCRSEGSNEYQNPS